MHEIEIFTLSAQDVTAAHNPLVRAYLTLRASTYQMKGFLTAEEINDDGTETDMDDCRIHHFLAVNSSGLCGCSRLIYKASVKDTPLPAEKFFPECFSEPLHSGAEISRLIIDSASMAQSRQIFTVLSDAEIRCASDLGCLSTCFAIIELSLARLCRLYGIPVRILSAPKFIPEYHAHKLLVQFMVHEREK